MTTKISVTRDLCQGAGQCVLYAPDVFDQDDHEGLVQLLQHEVGDDLLPAVQLAENRCPARVIRLETS